MRDRDFEINQKVKRDLQVMREGSDIEALHDDLVPLSKFITRTLRVMITFAAALLIPMILTVVLADKESLGIKATDSARDMAIKFGEKYARLEFVWGLLVGLIVTVFVIWICLKAFKFRRKRGWTTIATPYELESLFAIRPIFGLPLCHGAPLDALLDRKSPMCESLMSLELMLSDTLDGLPRKIMVTSSAPSEGKSTLAIGLAATIVRTGARAILVDGDLRAPSLESYLGIRSGEGLSNYLSGRPMPTPTKTEFGFDLLLAGPLPTSSGDLLRGDRLGQLINELLEKYDYVVIDCAPVLGLVDAVRIARECELILYAIQANHTWVYHALGAIRRLGPGTTIVPIVTMIPASQFGYSYGYGYNYGYGYGSVEK